jgi:hypothetical protein
MARDDFDNAGEYVQIKDLEGELVLFTPTQYVEEVETSFGTKDAVTTDLVVLSQDGQPEHDEVMIFQGALIGTLKRRIKQTHSIERDPVTGVVTRFVTTTTKRVLGVIAKGEGKKGQNAPYVLVAATDEQKDLARKYMAANPTPEPVKRQISQYIETGNQAAAPAPQRSQIPPTLVDGQPGPSYQGGHDEFAPSAANADDDPFAAAAGDPFAAQA